MEKMFYSMGEVAEMLDVAPSLIRFWEKQFDILKPRRAEGRKRFSAQEVANLKTIYHLVKERGMTLGGAAKHLNVNKKAVDKDALIAEKLQDIRALLLEVRDGIACEDFRPDPAPPTGRADGFEEAGNSTTFVEQTLF